MEGQRRAPKTESRSWSGAIYHIKEESLKLNMQKSLTLLPL